MSADAPDAPTGPEVVPGKVTVGRYVLVLGDPAGAKIEAVDGGKDPAALAQAMAQLDDAEHEPEKTGVASLEGAIEDASQVASAIKLGRSLFVQVAQGRPPSVAVIDSAVETLTGLLLRLDLDERWEEALRVTRVLAMLLALLERWIELLRSLQKALGTAKKLKDVSGQAWVLHEQGTLQLAAGNHAEADRLLVKAHDLREEIKDRSGLRMTDHNLQVLCKTLRAQLHKPTPPPRPHWRLLRRPLPALVLAVLLLVLGGVAGAVIRGRGGRVRVTSDESLAVEIEIAPTSPRAREPVAFRAAVEDGGPSAQYAWQFGDGERASSADPTHVYKSPGVYTATVSVSGVRGAEAGRGTRRIVVSGASAGETAAASITPKTVEVTATPSTVPGGTAASKITARALNADGEPISGQTVRFAVKPEDGSFSSHSATTNAEGDAETTLSFTSARTAAVEDTVQACATTRVCKSVTVQWEIQSTPIAATRAASEVTATGATLNGTLNPNGVTVTKCYFEYGASAAYGQTASCGSYESSGSSPEAVSAKHLRLTPGTIYHFRLVAASAAGPGDGEPQTFTTSEGLTKPKPSVITGAPGESTSSSVSVSGSVNPNGAQVEECEFQYGTTKEYGSQVKCGASPGAGTSAVPVSAGLTGLDPGQIYYYRLVATSAGGPGDGEQQSFKTPAAAPTVITGSYGGLTASGVTLNGSVNPNGAEVEKCQFEYSVVQHVIATRAQPASVVCTPSPGAGTSAVAVSAQLSGLAPGLLYQYKLVATNSAGTRMGSFWEFTTPAPKPTVTTGRFTEPTEGGVTLNGSVNPNGVEVEECEFQYAAAKEYEATREYGHSVKCTPSPGAGTGPVLVSAKLSGLGGGYDYRLFAKNAGGPGAGDNELAEF
ncbi:MAG: PKD domain-containing protein [Solirubrobacteraceae bacterium]